jgi:Zn ribbon nucleic-acid-binding protein
MIENAETCPACGARATLPVTFGLDDIPTGDRHCVECGWEGRP